MNTLILTLGTRGDLELFLLLARTLRDRGHHVRLVTSRFHAHRVEAAGIPCTPIDTTDPAALDALLASLASTPDLRTRTRAYVEKFLRPELAAATPALETLTASSDYFISNLKIAVAKNGVILPTAFVTYDPPAAIAELDRYSANLPRERILELAAFPKPFADPSAKWPERFHFTGFWFNPLPSSPLSAAFSTFLEAGPPPIILTTGSMRMFDPRQLAATVAAALERTGHRGVLLNIPPTARITRPNLFYADEAPYAALFPRAACILHHASMGATAETLRAGKPAILLPQILAQRHMADLLSNANAAAGIFDPATVTADPLAAAIHAATTDTRYSHGAAALQKLITIDAGIPVAAAAIEHHAGTISRQ